MRVVYTTSDSSVDLSRLGGQEGVSGVVRYQRNENNGPFGVPDFFTVQMTIAGTIKPASDPATAVAGQQAVDAAVTALNGLLNSRPDEVRFLRDDGTDTDLRMNAADAIGGLRVVGPILSPSRPADYVTGLDWSFDVSGDFAAEPNGAIISHEERITVRGGHARIERVGTAAGPVQEYVTQAITEGRLLQTGTIVRRGSHAPIPAPFDPLTYDPNESDVGVNTPLYRNGEPYAFSRTYTLVHVKSGPYDLPELGGKL